MMFEEVMIQQRVVMIEEAKGAVISVKILKISGGVGAGGCSPHDARRSDDSTKGDDARSGTDFAAGAAL